MCPSLPCPCSSSPTHPPCTRAYSLLVVPCAWCGGQLPGFSKQATLAPPSRPWHQKFPQPITPAPWSSTRDCSSPPSSSRKPMCNTSQAAPHGPKLVLWVFFLYVYDPLNYMFVYDLSPFIKMCGPRQSGHVC